ncbi:MAG TPA: YkgJ family cysteine cluster protein [Polyangiales bacterium]|nr:YkgJ family cysteine cluster protein [Polyangiales bacterium]
MDAPPCLACGACCFSRLATYVRVTGEDYTRLGDEAERVTTFVGNRCYMRMEHGHCAALEVSPGRYACQVYELRPETCRALERGSPQCDAERHGKASRALLALL